MSNFNKQTTTNNTNNVSSSSDAVDDDDDFWSTKILPPKSADDAAGDAADADDDTDTYPPSGSSIIPSEITEDGRMTHVTVDSTGISSYTSAVQERCGFLKRLGRTFPDHYIIGINYGDETEEGSSVLPYISKSGQFREEVFDTILNGANHEALISLNRTKLPMIRRGEIYTVRKSGWEHYDVAVEVNKSDYTLLASPSEPTARKAPPGSYERQMKITLALHGSLDDLLPIVDNYNSYLRTRGSKEETVCLVPLSRIQEFFPCKNRSVHSHANCPYGHARFSEDEAKSGIILTCQPSMPYTL